MDANNEAAIGEGIPNVSCDPDGVIMRQCTSDEISRAVRASRNIASVDGVPTRRYLTDPPTDFRTPIATAPIGDLGYSEAELKLIKQQEKLEEIEDERERDR